MLNDSIKEASFSLRKIDVKQTEVIDENITFDSDKVKILEFSNLIDKWEKELLFSENGFFSIKGKEIEGKTKEFYSELKKFINMKISEMKLKTSKSVDIVSDIKDKKLKVVLDQMEKYEKEQLSKWETQVYEEGLKSAINRAVLYKDNEQIIFSSLNNGLSILRTLAQKENWDSKIFKSKVDLFEADFFLSLINSYVFDKDLKAIVLFEKYKDKLIIDNIEKFEEGLLSLKNNVIAYNWAKELFSYNLSTTENKKEINEIKDLEIKKLVQNFLQEFQKQKEKIEEKEQQIKNEENWKQILSILESEPDKAFLYIDFSMDKKHQKSKENYIKMILKKGQIETDKKVFLELLKEIYVDFSAFKEKSLSDYREFLSKEDYEKFVEFQKMSVDEYNFFSSDYAFLTEKFKQNDITNEEDLYTFVQLIFSLKNDYSSKNKKEFDFETKEKLIEVVLKRFIKKDREE